MSVFDARGIPARWHRAKLSEMTPLDGQADAFAALQEVTPDCRHGLYLYGPVGVGKSLLTAARCMDILDAGKLSDFDCVRFVAWRDLIRNQRAQWGDGQKPDDIMQELRKRPLVALDDLGMGKVTALCVDVAEELLDDRYSSARPIIITSNHAPADIGSLLGPRVESRIRRTCRVLELTGPDRSELR